MEQRLLRCRLLTGHWQWRSFWRDLWVKGQSQSLSGRGRILSAGCEESSPVRPDQNQDWPGTPGHCAPLTSHCLHQNCKSKNRPARLTLEETNNKQMNKVSSVNSKKWKRRNTQKKKNKRNSKFMNRNRKLSFTRKGKYY